MSDSLGDFPRESRKGVAVCFSARSTLGVYLVHGHRPDPSSPVVPRAGSLEWSAHRSPGGLSCRHLVPENCPGFLESTWFPGFPPPLTGFPNNGVPQELPIGIPTNCNLHAIFQLDADFFPEFLLSRIRYIQNVLLIERNSVVLFLGCLGSSQRFFCWAVVLGVDRDSTGCRQASKT